MGAGLGRSAAQRGAAREGARARSAPEQSQLGGHPLGGLLRARVREGRSMPRRSPRAARPVRGRGHCSRGLWQADRGGPRGRAGRARADSKPRARQRRRLRGDRAGASARARAACRRPARTARPGRGHRRLPRRLSRARATLRGPRRAGRHRGTGSRRGHAGGRERPALGRGGVPRALRRLLRRAARGSRGARMRSGSRRAHRPVPGRVLRKWLRERADWCGT